MDLFLIYLFQAKDKIKDLDTEYWFPLNVRATQIRKSFEYI